MINPLAILGIVPSWAWAALLAASVAHGCVATGQRDAARADTVKARGELGQLQVDVARTKETAATTLATETAKVLELERNLAKLMADREKADARNTAIVRDYKGRLAAAADAAGRLRDPNAETCGSGGGGDSPAVAVAADPPGGAGSGAVPGGLLSVQLSDLLRDRLRRADELNVAYASCRADLIAVRQACGR